ncbi:MAG TPA: alpha/beta hydrolase [Nocardiopsis listeri]|uniref:alpha/beta fold hydrolase n=1 Tax=Nocardiopsis listeri TaxID=53440 RepID=UPI001E1A23AC|nr:alpha/beta fold hydrolase [Nocardiopsis listeri]HJE59698.1 alpha/beta hydrolase [Nocardiopsis listeri]
MPPARTVIRGTAAMMAGGLALTLATATPATAEPVDPRPLDDSATLDALAPFHEQEVGWALCEEELFAELELECARIEVPLDYADPGGVRIEIAILRDAASDPDARRGILLSNPGGPGGAGRALGADLGLSTRAGEVYDNIGMDPRGTGASTPLDCGSEFPISHPRPTDRQISRTTRETIRYTRACDEAEGDLRPHMTTANTARDMDVIRAALNEERLNYVGYSYGTYLGAVYGSLFPGRLDRSVLDSPVHPDGIWRESFMMQATAYTDNMRRYSAWLAEHDEVFGMGDDPEEILRVFEETADRLQEEPRDDHPSGQAYDGNAFAAEAGFAARGQSTWDDATWYLKDVIAGEPFPEVEPVPEIDQDVADLFGMNMDLHTAILCEARWPERLSTYHSDMRDHRDNHPYGTGAHWAGPQTCGFTRNQPAEPAVDLIPAGTTTPLVIAGEYDANTAYVGGPAMAKTLDGSLVTVTDDGGHGFYAIVDPVDLEFLYPCVNEAVDAYLVDGADPRDLECAGPPRPEATSDRPDAEDLGELFQRFEEYDGSEPTPARTLGHR